MAAGEGEAAGQAQAGAGVLTPTRPGGRKTGAGRQQATTGAAVTTGAVATSGAVLTTGPAVTSNSSGRWANPHGPLGALMLLLRLATGALGSV